MMDSNFTNTNDFTNNLNNAIDWAGPLGRHREGRPHMGQADGTLPIDVEAAANAPEANAPPNFGEDEQEDIDTSIAQAEQLPMAVAALAKTRLPDMRLPQHSAMALRWLQETADNNELIPNDETVEEQFLRNISRSHSQGGVFEDYGRPTGSTATTSRKTLFMSVLKHYAHEYERKKKQNASYRPSDVEREAARQMATIQHHKNAAKGGHKAAKSVTSKNVGCQPILDRMGIVNEIHPHVNPLRPAGICSAGRIDGSPVTTNGDVPRDEDYFSFLEKGNKNMDIMTKSLMGAVAKTISNGNGVNSTTSETEKQQILATIRDLNATIKDEKAMGHDVKYLEDAVNDEKELLKKKFSK